ncbi:MAG: type II secretion system inner membrane protein GspF [Xanthomonadales bacterium]|nr:type II secretion system inner membrane protein GspF [Xanthomonadales bacterium]
MPVYEYKAVASSGEVIQGSMEAVSLDAVIAKLQAEGNLPLSTKEASKGGFNLSSMRLGRQGMSAAEVGQFTEQMATLLGAGLPLDRSLTVLADLAENEKTKKVVTALRDKVRGGEPFSKALEAQQHSFNKLYINMVRAGEIGGTLDVTLDRLAVYLASSKDLKDSVVSALIYPILLVVLAIGSLILLLVYVIPQFTPIFEELGGDLPMLTRIVLAIGGALQSYWWLMAGIAFFAVYAFRSMLADEQKRRSWDGWLLKRRWVGDLVSKLETARLARTLGTLLTNGVPLLSALGIARNVLGNTVMQDDIAEARAQVQSGGSLARNLAASGHFPKFALQMVSVGEETGQLDAMLTKVADAYDREVRTTIDRLMALFVPLLTLLLAGMIGLIVMSVLVAILGINDLVA